MAYLPERDASRVEARTPVRITRRTGQSRSAESVVLRVGQGIQPLPPRLWSNPQTPVYGRAVVVAPVPAMELVPGELLEVRFFGR